MVRLSFMVLFVGALAISGCSKPGSSNVLKDADQEAIDAYDAQLAEKDAALQNYEGAKD